MAGELLLSTITDGEVLPESPLLHSSWVKKDLQSVKLKQPQLLYCIGSYKGKIK